MSGGLVERLRAGPPSDPRFYWIVSTTKTEELLDEAADRIEALEAAIVQAREALERAEAAMTTVVEGDPMGVRGPKVCKHGRFSWEGCENCIADVLMPALESARQALSALDKQ